MTEAELRSAAAALQGVALETPLVGAPGLGVPGGGPVRLKCEHLQPMGAFKIRGAWNSVSRLSPEQRSRGIVTHSSGNHGQALALAGARAGIRTVVVMPESAPAIKVSGVRSRGAEVVLVPGPASERGRVAQEMADTQGLVMVPPYESHDVVAGQATCTLEILDMWPAVTMIVAPVGGGGLLAGACAATSALRPDVKVFGVEPVGAPKLTRAMDAGHPVVLEQTASVADGLLPMQIGVIPFGYIQPVLAGVVQVSDAEIIAAVRFLYQHHGMRVEPSGAATVAALLAGHLPVTGPTAAILSGGNIDPERFADLVR
ncbi:MAG: pyridoxal-phosphate dependent enzyme [Gemmatimonadota bacterium]|nr:pyridoxal-phosphate dependent enzyme [Gemmatimonadota bacterium]